LSVIRAYQVSQFIMRRMSQQIYQPNPKTR
jgi:hypothetical protein